MRMSVRKAMFLLIPALSLALAAGVAPAVARGNPPAAQRAAAAAAPYCGITWGSGDKTAGPLSTAPLLTVRTGQQECWDRIVFELNGTAQGYSVRYSDQILTEGQGLDLVPYTAGGAFLWVTLRAPATSGALTGDHVANVLGYDTLRDVVSGGSFEGYTTFAVGVRARLPFRVLLLAGPGTHSRIVVDVAHQW
jgi:hypothetical protein